LTASAGEPERLRIDKWLWHARFFKSRSLAGETASSGRLRVNGARITKAAYLVKEGDVLTFPQGRRIRVVRVLGMGTRRGPAAEAERLYDDLDPPVTGAVASAPAGRRLPSLVSGRKAADGRRNASAAISMRCALRTQALTLECGSSPAYYASKGRMRENTPPRP